MYCCSSSVSIVCSADFFSTSPSARPIFFRPSSSASLGINLLPFNSIFEMTGRSTTWKTKVLPCCTALMSSNRPDAYMLRIALAMIGSLTRSPLLIGTRPYTLSGVKRTNPSNFISCTMNSSAAYTCCATAIALTSARGINKCVCCMPVFSAVNLFHLRCYKRIKSLNNARSIILPSSTIPIFNPTNCICSETGLPRINSTK